MVWAADLAPVDLFAPVVSSKAFAIGLLFGALGYLATGIIAALRHRTREGGGVAFAGALFLATRDLYSNRGAPLAFGAALVLLAVGGHLAQRVRPRIWAQWYVGPARTALALLPGAAVLAAAFPVETPGWLRFAVGGSAVLTGLLVHDYDATQGPRGAPFLFLLFAAVAVYFTLPDTELPLVMLGVAIPLALISFPQPLRRLGPAGRPPRWERSPGWSYSVVAGARARSSQASPPSVSYSSSRSAGGCRRRTRRGGNGAATSRSRRKSTCSSSESPPSRRSRWARSARRSPAAETTACSPCS